MCRLLLVGLATVACAGSAFAQENDRKQAIDRFLAGRFEWVVGAPVLSAAQRSADPCYAVKDPSIVRFHDRWHLFATIRSQKRLRQIEYLSFSDWQDIDKAPRHILTLSERDF